MPLYYLDTSAIVKLVQSEPESDALGRFLAAADLACSEIVFTELPRAIRRTNSESGEVELLMDQAEDVLEALALVPVDRDLLRAAGALAEPALRSLDAIHLASALTIFPHDGLVTYDERQAAAARLAGLRTYAPPAGGMS